MSLLLGLDTGGTFTDAVLFDEDRGVVAKAKALTTRADYAAGLGAAVADVLGRAEAVPGRIGLVSLSTTLATNAVVEGQGGRVALILVGLGEAALDRAGLRAALKGDPVAVVDGGHTATGREAMPLGEDAVRAFLAALDPGVTGVAVAGAFAVRNPAHEERVRDLVTAIKGLPVTCSHELTSALDGPRRALTAVLNARLIGLLARLVRDTGAMLASHGIRAPLMVVKGDGSLVSAHVALTHPIETVLSGPAASLVGARFLCGAEDALVSDIGGTTTDIAALEAGLPRLSADGAQVGGFRTMVRAVAMQTRGLGGDSEVRLVQRGLGLRVALGPRRAVPLSLLAGAHPGVGETLAAQAARARPAETDGRFLVSAGRAGAMADGLSRTEAAILEALGHGPQALEAVAPGRAALTAIDRLAARGLVLLAGPTPTDAAHVLGRDGRWDADAARAGLALLARTKDPRGRAFAPHAETVAARIADALTRASADALIDAGLAADGAEGLSAADPAIARALDGHRGTVSLSVRLDRPVIALGASAATWYPAIADLVGTRALIPEHADVANAIGAVAGHVRVAVDALVTQPEEGLFRIHVDGTPEDFPSLETAAAEAEARAATLARGRAREAGSGDVETRTEREDVVAHLDGGLVSFVEARIRVTAFGRPRIAG
ncbi:hydantoinase/oxoprolinase family protein [Futiania mangrovi]|uniref:Hydantoinase/oxoprolinase family protein n=1 Tax=Futiania mangrovi TaxID=2959716 RepID=A0A9J6P8G2_9PROT|nr:hydantoinase/oxoprolinase family protein [Futiania mangrovii]MCP1334805.1 hydantoinase/oxoprolinase family protein [Futiania mangrovii]